MPEAAAGPWPRRNAPGWDVPSGKKPLPDMVAMYPTSPSADFLQLVNEHRDIIIPGSIFCSRILGKGPVSANRQNKQRD